MDTVEVARPPTGTLFYPGDETGRHAALKMLWSRKVLTGSTPVWGTV